MKELYDGFRQKALRSLYENLPTEIKEKPHAWEKLNISIGLMEDYCHAYMDKSFSEDELIFMREEVINLVDRLLWEAENDI